MRILERDIDGDALVAAIPTGSQRTHIDAGEAALARIKQTAKQTFSDWLAVGRALCDLQELALNLSGANQPVGKAYNAAYAGLVETKEHLGGLDKGTSSRARWMYANREAVEDWHGNLTDNERAEINHPRVVKDRYAKHLKELEAGDDEEDAETKQPKAKKPSAAELQRELFERELASLKAYNAELEAANAKLEAENKELDARNKDLARENAELDAENVRLLNANEQLARQIAKLDPELVTPHHQTNGKAEHQRGGRKSTRPWRDTPIGGHFDVYDAKQPSLAAQAAFYHKRYGIHFTTAKQPDGAIRMTRDA